MKLFKQKFSFGLWGIIVLLLFCNILLILQNIQIRNQLSKFEPVKVIKGEKILAFQGKDLSGNNVKINYSEGKKKQVLLFFRTNCGFCHKQMTNWKKLFESAEKQKYKFTAITTDKDIKAIGKYLRKYNSEDWDVMIVDEKQAKKAKLLATPITIVVNNDGEIEKAWNGLWQKNDVISASEYFAIKF